MKNSYEKRWYGLGVLSIILTITSIDNTVLDIALPAISTDLGASAKDLQWLIDIYILIFTALLLTLGALGDRYGRRLMLQGGIVFFALASLGAALSSSMNELITYRGLTGFGAAMIMPSTLSLIADMFQDKDERQKAIAIWGMMFGIGFGLGPLLGGYLVDYFSWQAVFYINIPISLIAIVLSMMWLRESKENMLHKNDFLGMVISVVAMFATTYGIIEAGILGWSDHMVWSYLIIGGVFIALFIVYENRIKNPMLPLVLFKNRAFSVSALTLSLAMFGIMGTMFFFSQFFQTVQGYTALQTGLLLVPLTAGIMISSGMAPALVKMSSIKTVVSLGMVIASLSITIFAAILAEESSMYVIMFGFFLLGFGFGVAMVPATDAIMDSLPEDKLGVGSAVNDVTRELGGALSIAILGSLVNNAYIEAINRSQIADKLKEGVSSSIQSAHIIATEISNTQIISIADNAFINALSFSLYIGGGIIAIAAIIAYLYLPINIEKTKLEA